MLPDGGNPGCRASSLWHVGANPARLRMSAVLVGQLAAAAPGRGSVSNAEAVERAVALAAEADRIGAQTRLGPEGRAWHERVHAEVARLRWASGVGPVPLEEMERLWRAATDSFDELGDPYEHARSAVRLAAVLKAAGRADDARVLNDQARTVARRLGAAPLLAEARADVREPVGDLTPRELEVIALVTAGRSNGEIATQLFISTKTASVHVSNILAKLGAASRTEAAAIARRRDLSSAPAGCDASVLTRADPQRRRHTQRVRNVSGG